MVKIKACLGYTSAVLCIFIVMAAFMGMDLWMNLLVNSTGIKVSPIYTGGDVNNIISMDGYDVKIHKPVFQGLISDREKGFVQIDWVGKNIPSKISQDIDYDNDGKKDFNIIYQPSTEKCVLKAYNKNIISLDGVYKLDDGYAVRVICKKKVAGF